jgi:RNA polymerase sigma factor (sigma-70 family)
MSSAPGQQSGPAHLTPGSREARDERSARLADHLLLAQKGQTAALQEVVRELNPLLWQVARAQGLGAEEAADVVQTTWLQLLRGLSDIRSPGALTSWLVTITRRDAIRRDQRRRADGQVSSDILESVADPVPDATDRLIVAERDQVLADHFRRLPERCRALLRILSQADRPDYDVVAQAVGMPRGSIGPTRGRCLARLRAMLLADPRWDAA